MINIKIREHIIRYHIVSLGGRLDAFNTPELREQFQTLLSNGATRIVLDLEYVEFMDSAALAALVSLLKQARQASGDVQMVMPRAEAARRILSLTKFDQVFPIISTIDEAVKAR
jgi:anti-anti-sigma factor